MMRRAYATRIAKPHMHPHAVGQCLRTVRTNSRDKAPSTPTLMHHSLSYARENRGI